MTSPLPDHVTPLDSASPRIAIGIETRDNGLIGHMRFTYPERHNIIDLAGWQAIPAALQSLVDAGDVRLIVLRGTGGQAFVAGADISQFETAFSGETAVHYDAATMQAFDAIAHCKVPTLAAIEGFCIGGGLAIATSCDLRLAREDSSFGVPAGRLGLAYPPNATLRLVDIVGRSAANEILFTADLMTCARAASIQLVNRQASAKNFEAELTAWVDEIAANAPLSLQTAKYIMNNPQAEDIDKRLAACINSDDYEEGRSAFMQKRRPRFSGT